MVWLYFLRSDLVQFPFPLFCRFVYHRILSIPMRAGLLWVFFTNPDLINSRPEQGAEETLKSAEEGGRGDT